MDALIQLKIGFKPAEIKAQLTRFGFRRVLRAVGMKFRDITWSNFGAAGSHRAAPWPPYARNYPKWNKRKGDPATLIRTGHLKRSIEVDSSHDDFVEIEAKDIPYADRHQFGKSPTPARPYYPIVGTGQNYDLTPYARMELERAAEREAATMLEQLFKT